MKTQTDGSPPECPPQQISAHPSDLAHQPRKTTPKYSQPPGIAGTSLSKFRHLLSIPQISILTDKSPAVATLLALCLLIYLSPYYGIRHDSVVYFGQALLRWKPTSIDHDLFFAYGSQADFTILPYILGALLSHFPAGELFLILTLTGKLLFAFASLILISQILPDRYRYWGLLAILIMPPFYGGFNMVSYSEPFMTGRSFADPLALLALAALLQKRWYLGAALWLFAFSVHPLQALPALLVVWTYLIIVDRRWLHLVWITLLIPLYLIFAPNSSNAILTKFDPQWLSLTLQANKLVFLSTWRPDDWSRLITDIFIVSLALQREERTIKRTAKALLLSTLIAFSASFTLTDLLKLTLPAGLQLWRMHWLLHYFAMSILPLLSLHLYYLGKPERPRFAMLIAIAALGSLGFPASALLIPLFLFWPALRQQVRPLIEFSLTASIALLLALIYIKFIFFTLNQFHALGGFRDIMRPEFLLISHPLIMGSLLALGIYFWQQGQTKVRATMTLFLCCWLLYAGLNWDRRSTISRELESAQNIYPSPFGIKLAPGAQVLWINDGTIDTLLAPWLILERPSYFTTHQMAGVVFNRGTGEEALARQKQLDTLLTVQKGCNMLNRLNNSPEECTPNQELIRDTCKATDGKLTYIISHYKLSQNHLGHWSIPIKNPSDQPHTYYLYQCSDFENSSQSQIAAQPNSDA